MFIPTETDSAYLFYCNDDNSICNAITRVGYYINGNSEAFSCKLVNPSNKDIKCSKIAIESNCDINTIGKIFFKGESDQIKPFLCIDHNSNGDIEVELKENAGDYLVGYSDNNIYGINMNEYVVVTIKKNSVELKYEYDNSKYIYVDKTNNNRIIKKGEECPEINNSMIEYSCKNGICKS